MSVADECSQDHVLKAGGDGLVCGIVGARGAAEPDRLDQGQVQSDFADQVATRDGL